MAAACMLLAAGACSSTDIDVPEPPQYDGSIHMALNVATNNNEQTRLTKEITQSDGNFRGLAEMRIVPVKEDGTILSPLGESLNRIGETTFLFNKISDLTIGTRSFYVYARANSEDTAHHATNGSLTHAYSETSPTSNTFSPRKIYTGALVSDQKATPAYLTSIAIADNWHTTDDPDMQKLFEEFINKKGAVISPLAGSSANMLAYVNAWYKKVKGTAVSDLRDSILAAITSREYVSFVNDSITALSDDMTVFPENLPDGAAAILWDGSKFSYTEERNKLSDYVYPAELWYYADSRIYTSADSRADYYTSESSWNGVLTHYENRGDDGDGATIDADTRSVALIEPLRYGVANLCISIQTDAEKDGGTYYIRDGNEEYSQSRVDLKKTAGEITGSFPLTAILVGSQPDTMDYKFEPKNPTDNTEHEYIIYDSSIETERICLGDFIGKDEKGKEKYSSELHTLTLQTKPEEPVKVVLEFENNSSQAFLNAEQAVIYPGTKFYLVAEVIAPATTDYNRQVFTKGYLTTLRFTIRSLAQAYNALPNLRTNNLRVFTVQQAGIRKWTDGITQDHNVHNW